jgi:hypothetical protein
MQPQAGARNTRNSRKGRSRSDPSRPKADDEPARPEVKSDSPVASHSGVSNPGNDSRAEDLAARVAALKIEEAEMGFLNTCLKNVGKCKDAEGVPDYIRGIRDVLPLTAFTLQQLVPSLRHRFEGTAKDTYTMATSSQQFSHARGAKMWEESWNAFEMACLNLSKASADEIKQVLLGPSFQHGVIDGEFNADETFQQAVIRWEEELRNARSVLGAEKLNLIKKLSKDLFLARLRGDYRAWFLENRKSLWEDDAATLLDLAEAAKDYEGTDAYRTKGKQLGSKFKSGALVASIGGYSGNHKNGSGQDAANAGPGACCWVCHKPGHGMKTCPAFALLRRLHDEKNKGQGQKAEISALRTLVKELETDLREDIAAVAQEGEVSRSILSDKTALNLA